MCDLRFFSCSFQSSFFFCIFSILTMTCYGEFLSWFCLFGVLSTSYISGSMSFLCLGELFSSVLLKIWSTTTCSSSSPSKPLFKYSGFSLCPTFPACYFFMVYFFIFFLALMFSDFKESPHML